MRLFVARSVELFGFGKVPALGGTMSMKLLFNNVHASVYEIAFEFILRNVYIYKLPPVHDMGLFALCIKASLFLIQLHHWKLLINTV